MTTGESARQRHGGQSFIRQLRNVWHGLVLLWLLYSFFGQLVQALYLAVFHHAQGTAAAALRHAPPGGFAITPAAGIAGPEHLVLLVTCALAATIVVGFLKSVCSEEWVSETVQIEECWEEVEWYNPWSWVKAVFCSIYEVVKEVLRLVCRYVPKDVLLWTLVCYVVAIVALA